MVRRQLGDVLITRGNATLGQITEALRIQRDSEEHARLGRILVEMGVIDEGQLAGASPRHTDSRAWTYEACRSTQPWPASWIVRSRSATSWCRSTWPTTI